MTSVALTIAGSDPSGGAGLQADLKTFHQHGVYGASVVALLTVQNTRSVTSVRIIDPEFVCQQLEAVLDDLPPDAAKTGALGDASVIEAVAGFSSRFSFPLVVDPVMISKHGVALLERAAVLALRDKLLPTAWLVTPNLHEAEALVEMKVRDDATMMEAARAIGRLGCRFVLIKGGHRQDEPRDLLWSEGRGEWFSGKRTSTPHTHGVGCVLSAAIAARLALGQETASAVELAKRFVTRAIETNPGLGSGFGPVNMHAQH